MKTNLHFNGNSAFLSGLVFGFDIGIDSIGYAVRRGAEFLETGVIICPKKTPDLKMRRKLRRNRRTLRSKKYRSRWLTQELERLGIPRPKDNSHDPLALRARAIKGTSLSAEELHAAIAHLWRRRGYAEVPWASREANDERKQEHGIVKEGIRKLREEMITMGCQFPCEFLLQHSRNQRRRVWPRDLLKTEFDAIVAAQRNAYPKLAEKADWLLYGDTRTVKNHRVYFKSNEGRNPGVLGLRWPRHDNRSPALDLWHPLDAEGKSLHVVRKNKKAFRAARWELALMNFRVLDSQTRQKRDPNVDFPDFVAELRKLWRKKGNGVSLISLKKTAKPYSSKFLLADDQKALTPDDERGRARFSTPTLRLLREQIGAGQSVDPPQIVLQRRGESWQRAMDRHLANIYNPQIQYRLVLFIGLLNQLIKRCGQPSMIIMQADRMLGLRPNRKRIFEERRESFREQREIARTALKAMGQAVSADAVEKYRLWQEAGRHCPFCLEPISQTTLLGSDVDIERLVPRLRVDCSEFYNLTIGHTHCNRYAKGDRSPFDAFSSLPQWEAIKNNAVERFRGRKLEIFLSPSAEDLIEQKAHLAHIFSIVKALRRTCLIRFGWLGEDGRDPVDANNASSRRFHVSYSHLTSRLRKSWGLDHVLYDEPSEDNQEAWKQFVEKTRGDFRHHAVDAMVISCTLPWQARHTQGATDELGERGWWSRDENGCSLVSNPFGLDCERAKTVIERAVVRQHVSRSNHRKAYATTVYVKKAQDAYVAREVFTTLTPENLGSIYPKEFSRYCKVAWERYRTESPEIDIEMRATKGNLPEGFTTKLCFTHFQRWRATAATHFVWPNEVKIPIRSVRLISVKDDTAVTSFNRGANVYVKRTGFKEVRIHVSEDGKTLIPVLVPYWCWDRPFSLKPIAPNSKSVAVIRRGDTVTLRKPLAAGAPAGQYRIISLKQKRLQLVPSHLQNDENILKAAGLKGSGASPQWPEFLRAIGFELPDSASTRHETGSRDGSVTG